MLMISHLINYQILQYAPNRVCSHAEYKCGSFTGTSISLLYMLSKLSLKQITKTKKVCLM